VIFLRGGWPSAAGASALTPQIAAKIKGKNKLMRRDD
jgi:hypothetical protein